MSNEIQKIFDIETNGFLDTMDRVHCIAMCDPNGSNLQDFRPEELHKGIDALENSDTLIGHNIITFDIPALERHSSFIDWESVVDTLILSRLLFSNIYEMDLKKKVMPAKLWGRQSLKAWGYRLNVIKGDYEGPWDSWNEEMHAYCIQDVKVTQTLYQYLMDQPLSEQALHYEQEFQKIMFEQEQNGVHFDEEKACQMYEELRVKKEELHAKITEAVPPWEKTSVFLPKRDNKTLGYKKGIPFTKRKLEPFNPGSRVQISKLFKDKYKWQPVEFTDKGNPKVTSDVLEPLPYPEVPLLVEYLNHVKLTSQLATGKEAWLKYVEGGKIYGRINTMGAISFRCTHSKPNLAQVPSINSFMGKECRELFYAPDKYKMVGCDASGLELRCLGHYLSAFDGGNFIQTLLHGDIHTANQQAAGLPTRDNAKTFIYAFNYGAGDKKLGSIVEPHGTDERKKVIGKDLRFKFFSKVPAIKRLIDLVKHKYNQRGFLIGLDGRRLYPRSDHKALNTLLQGAGAIIMKYATVIMWRHFDKNKVIQVLNVHDENQLYVLEDYAEEAGKIAADAITKAGEVLEMKCPLAGEYKIGGNWSETH